MEEAKKKIRSFRFIATGIKTTELLVAGYWLLVTRNQRPATRNQQPNPFTMRSKSFQTTRTVAQVLYTYL